MRHQTYAMDSIEHERWLWFVLTFDSVRTHQNERLLSAHALLTEVDIQIAFCAGAWISTIVLACSAVEAKFRQIETDDYKTNVGSLFGADPDLKWLREMRNELMHAGEPGSPSKVWNVEGHEVAATHNALEADAKRAIEIMFRSIYGQTRPTPT